MARLVTAKATRLSGPVISMIADGCPTGALPDADHQLGRTMVEYPGHPLTGRIVPVVRRYGQRERGQWVIGLPDGSRQYIPRSWCSPLSSSGRTLPVPAPPQDGPPEDASTLSLSALRNLAALMRRLQDEAAQRRGAVRYGAISKRGSTAGTTDREWRAT
ncbi:MAG: hypothetical protein ACR2PL_15055 [Dehalococcoidia bacterium]